LHEWEIEGKMKENEEIRGLNDKKDRPRNSIFTSAVTASVSAVSDFKCVRERPISVQYRRGSFLRSRERERCDEMSESK